MAQSGECRSPSRGPIAPAESVSRPNATAFFNRNDGHRLRDAEK